MNDTRRVCRAFLSRSVRSPATAELAAALVVALVVALSCSARSPRPPPASTTPGASAATSPGKALSRSPAPLAVSPTHIRVATQNGLALQFDRQTQQFTRLTGNGLQARFSAGSDQLGISLAEIGSSAAGPGNAAAGTVSHAVTRDSAASHAEDTLLVHRDDPARGLRLDERWTARTDRIELGVTLTRTGPAASNRPVERAIRACVELPVDLVGKRWHHHFHRSEPILPGKTYQTTLEAGVDIGHWLPRGRDSHLGTDLPLNLHGINLVGDDTTGLALAAHPDWPAAYFVSYDARARRYAACFHLGLYSAHRTRPDQATFGLVLFQPDEPAWGLRAALASYARMYPALFRGGSGTRPIGMTAGEYSYDAHPDPAHFHITSMWNQFLARNRELAIGNLLYAWPTGYVDRGMRLERQPLDRPCPDCPATGQAREQAHLDACLALYRDNDQGTLRFAETCHGLWSVTECKPAARSARPRPLYGPVHDRRRRDLCRLVPARVVAPSHLPLRLFGQMPIYRPFFASYLRGAGGEYLGTADALFPIDGPSGSGTCYIDGFDPDPGVVAPGRAGDGAPTDPDNFGQLNLEIARRALGVYGPSYLHRDATRGLMQFDGVAVDTVGAYLRPDFHPDMLAVATYPLAYDPPTGRVVTLEHLGLAAFLAQLRQTLPPGGLLASNGFPISGLFGQGVDLFIRELVKRQHRVHGGLRTHRIDDELYDDDLATRLRHIYRLRMVALDRSITLWARFVRTQAEATRTGLAPVDVLLRDVRRILPLYTALGIYVLVQRTGIGARDSFFQSPQDPHVVAVYREHLDAVYALQQASWQPVPYAVASEPALVIERFGSEYITLYNPLDHPVQASVGMAWSRFRPGARPAGVRERASGHALPAVIDDSEVRLADVALAPGAVTILVITE